MYKHAKGNWAATEYTKENGRRGYQVHIGSWKICEAIEGESSSDIDDAAKANANLIAAAPDLLDAIESLVEAYVRDMRDFQDLWNKRVAVNSMVMKWVADPQFDEEVMQAKAAIAKAKGECNG